MAILSDIAQAQQTQQSQQTQQQGVASNGLLARTWRPMTMLVFVAPIVALLAGCASVPQVACMRAPPPPINLLAVPAPLPPVPADLPRPR